nr:MAG TPA: Cro/C1-type HTH DNA-binding domain protein [Caudoviricetes sp.]
MIAAMTASCMTPKEIAQKAGISDNAVYRVRKGYMVKMEILGKICRVLGIDVNDVLDFERMEQYRKEKGQLESGKKENV